MLAIVAAVAFVVWLLNRATTPNSVIGTVISRR